MYAILLPELDKRQTRLVIHVSKKLARVLACSAVCIQMAPTTTFTSPNIIHASLVTITLCSKRSDLHLDVVTNSEKRVLNLNCQEALSYDADWGILLQMKITWKWIWPSILISDITSLYGHICMSVKLEKCERHGIWGIGGAQVAKGAEGGGRGSVQQGKEVRAQKEEGRKVLTVNHCFYPKHDLSKIKLNLCLVIIWYFPTSKVKYYIFNRISFVLETQAAEVDWISVF